MDEASLLDRFDQLVDAGIVLYSEEQQTTTVSDGDLKVKIILTPAFAKKPTAQQSNGQTPESQPQKHLQPGSDIDTTGFELGDVGEAHFLAMNKFCFVRPHMLVMTKDGFRRQHERLSWNDLDATRTALLALGEDKDYVVFFNCGIPGGCSRLHKHIQIMPYPEDNFAAFLDRPGGEEPDVPFVWFYSRFDFDLNKAATEDILAIYDDLLDKSTMAAEYYPGKYKDSPPDACCPHNLVFTKRWMLVLPRRRGVVGDAGANAIGMLGVMPVSKQAEVDAWVAKGPRFLLSEFGVPKAGD
ncbi:ATP adenylyltransferase [Thozetella sp. PMI_491]|nr:ATP adenylyltransferase [Thozetella sp. PMI_491]